MRLPSSSFACVAIARLAVVMLLSAPLPAQQAAEAPPVCYGFSFGAWRPALDWKAAGHAERRHEKAAHDVAPGDRRWAVEGDRSDAALILFPSWWPAGVSVELPRRPASSADTVSGRATAFVPHGARTAPTSRVRAWGVRCGPP